MNQASTQYSARMKKVLDYIDGNLDKDLTLDQLSQVASFSKFHFQRQFRVYAGISVIRLVQLIRLKRASYQLVRNSGSTITDIALDAKFENAESFSRAFKQAFQQTPSEFKRKPFNQAWLEATTLPIFRGENTMHVDVVNFKGCKVAAMEHRGPIENKFQTIAKFIEWRKASAYPPSKHATYNIFYNDEASTTPAAFHFDVCCEIEADIAENSMGVASKTLAAGRCAVLRHLGRSDNLEESMTYLYRDWLPSSGEELRDSPCFVHRVKLESEGSEIDAISDIYLPLV